MNWHTLTVRELSQALTKKEVSSVELCQYFLKRIAQHSQFNAFLDVQEDLSIHQAKLADERIAKGQSSPLTGIPIAHKDVFVTKHWKSTAASRMLENYISPFDATVVSLLGIHGAGMVCIGKTNMDEFAMGSSNENSAFGPARNPWNHEYVSGGSSGGSAVAVAAGLVPIATGTDTGGSIRQPAAFCGISGIKPTYGTVSRYGMIAYASSLDQAGPMGKTAADCGLILNAISGHDAKDSTSLVRDKDDYLQYLGKNWSENNSLPLKGLRIGVPEEYFAEGLHNDVRMAVDEALETFKRLGAITVRVQLPQTSLSIPVYYVLAPAEASSNLSRYDGVRYGYRAKEYKDLAQMYERSRSEGFGSEVKRRILIGAYVLSQGYYDAYYLQAQKIRRIIAQDFQSAFATCDILMGPVAPNTAWKIGEKSKDPTEMYLEDIFTLSVNLAGLPAMSIPCGFNKENLPIGIQFIGNYFSEAKMIQIADHFQKETDFHTQTPNLNPLNVGGQS
jgi:aspartyl-tRNA(Asn)/glutamyl-tRNA(Gln) amidotransferase subunit A